MRILASALLCLPLAGCFGIWPKPLPDWAMNTHVDPAPSTRERPDRGPPPVGPSAAYMTPANANDIKPFSPEWQAREDAFDDRLRRTMNICRGC